MEQLDKCKYRLPCGWCDRKNEKCELLQESIPEKLCNHEWYEEVQTGADKIVYCCRKCGERRIY